MLRTRIPTPGFGRAAPSIIGAPYGEQGPSNRSQITGNAELYYAAWQLSRRGWHVMPTIRNARGSDLIVVNEDETTFFGLQSKALNKRAAVGLGTSLDALRSDWWIITVNANSDAPRCYVLALDDVRRLAARDRGGGQRYWLEPPNYEHDTFREAWDRIGVSLLEGRSRRDLP